MVSWMLCPCFENRGTTSLCISTNKEGVVRVSVAVYGAARVVIGQPLVELSFDASSVTLGQVLEKMVAAYPRARPYLLDQAGRLPSYMRVLINNTRPDPDATPAMVLHNDDHVALLVAVAGGVRDS
jgi:molybdopterin converting factor small subunit